MNNIPVLCVSGESLAETYEAALVSFYNNGTRFKTQYDKPDDTRWEYTYHGRLQRHGSWKERIVEDGKTVRKDMACRYTTLHVYSRSGTGSRRMKKEFSGSTATFVFEAMMPGEPVS